MNSVSTTNLDAAGLASPHTPPERARSTTDGELSLDELDAVCGGLARVWDGAPRDRATATSSSIEQPSIS
jgi:hypothetical protein